MEVYIGVCVEVFFVDVVVIDDCDVVIGDLVFVVYVVVYVEEVLYYFYYV